MKKLFLVVLAYLVSLGIPYTSFAVVATQSGTTTIRATVGGSLISLSGYIAPYASVVLIANNATLASTVADAAGNFSLTNVPILKGLTSFCLDGVDFKKLGESEACFSIDPATGTVSKSNIFLPPTLGVYRVDVTVGDKALAFGYGMPGAQVSLHISNQNVCVTKADSSGYYECRFVIEKTGSFTVTADSLLNKVNSEPPAKGVLIQGISGQKQIGKVTPVPFGNGFSLPGGLVIWLILIGLILLIILLVLLHKFKPEWFPKGGLPNPSVMYHHAFDELFKERKLHHSWMDGVGF